MEPLLDEIGFLGGYAMGLLIIDAASALVGERAGPIRREVALGVTANSTKHPMWDQVCSIRRQTAQWYLVIEILRLLALPHPVARALVS